MNERLKQLAEQAGFKPFDVREDDIKFKKFAELIVRECADVLRQESERLYKLASEEEDDVFAGNFEICAEKCIANEIAIKDHFGVEE